MNNQEFKAFVGNKIFGVDFIKKDGSLRTYNARVNVKKHTKGGTNPVEHISNLVSIFEMDAGQYRTLNINTITQLRCEGKILESNSI